MSVPAGGGGGGGVLGGGRIARQGRQHTVALSSCVHGALGTDRQTFLPTPPPPANNKVLNKNTVRTEVFVAHALRYPINSVPVPCYPIN